MSSVSSSSESQKSDERGPANAGPNGAAIAAAYRRRAAAERWSTTRGSSRASLSQDPISRCGDGEKNRWAADSGPTQVPPNGHALPNVKSHRRPSRVADAFAYAASSDHSVLSQSGRGVGGRFNHVGSIQASSTPPKPASRSHRSCASTPSRSNGPASHHQRVYGLAAWRSGEFPESPAAMVLSRGSRHERPAAPRW